MSAGTERMLVDFGRAGLISKARQQPEKVKMVLEKLRTDGVLQTFQAVKAKLDDEVQLGYCNVGKVESIGAGVNGWAVGDRVVSNGCHAELVSVGQNLCAKVPDEVSDEAASFTVLGAIGLQGIRLAKPTLGECFVVIGLGVIGLLTVQLLKASGCRVLGVDFDETKLSLARDFGADTVNPGAGECLFAAAKSFSRGRGVDGVIITAATASSDPVSQGARVCRKRGRIILVGVCGLELSRSEFYEKELTFQVSCSYGPGRYDPAYEVGGADYPVGFVRWTEQRNFEAVLDMMAAGTLRTEQLITHRFDVSDAEAVYDLIASKAPCLGVLFEYPDRGAVAKNSTVLLEKRCSASGVAATSEGCSAGQKIGFVGAGSYSQAVLIPAFRRTKADLEVICSNGGKSAAVAGRKFGFARATSSSREVIDDPTVSVVVVTTRHDSHADLVVSALNAGKHVFTEKPLCLTLDELARVREAALNSSGTLMVGFNRRFSPHVRAVKQELSKIGGPIALSVSVNAGVIPSDHWVHDSELGGGRLVGEACHFIDLVRFLAADSITEWSCLGMAAECGDTAVISLKFANGSIANINYFSNGHKSVPKEQVNAFASGRVFTIDNFRETRCAGTASFTKNRTSRQEKGQNECVDAFLAAISRGAASPISLEEIFEVSRMAIEVQNAIRLR